MERGFIPSGQAKDQSEGLSRATRLRTEGTPRLAIFIPKGRRNAGAAPAMTRKIAGVCNSQTGAKAWTLRLRRLPLAVQSVPLGQGAPAETQCLMASTKASWEIGGSARVVPSGG
jgi:hypothetical protein